MTTEKPGSEEKVFVDMDFSEEHYQWLVQQVKERGLPEGPEGISLVLDDILRRGEGAGTARSMITLWGPQDWYVLYVMMPLTYWERSYWDGCAGGGADGLRGQARRH